MDPIDIRRIQYHKTKLTQQLDPNKLIKALMEKDVLIKSDHEEICKAHSNQAQMEVLLEILELRGPNVYREFRDVLSQEYSLLVKELDQTPFSVLRGSLPAACFDETNYFGSACDSAEKYDSKVRASSFNNKEEKKDQTPAAAISTGSVLQSGAKSRNLGVIKDGTYVEGDLYKGQVDASTGKSVYGGGDLTFHGPVKQSVEGSNNVSRGIVNAACFDETNYFGSASDSAEKYGRKYTK